MKKRYAAATDVAREQYLEIEKQKENYNQLQVKHVIIYPLNHSVLLILVFSTFL